MSNRHVIEDHLAQVPLFACLAAKERRAVRDLFSEIDVVAGHVLARQGSRAGEFLIIVSGTASIDQFGLHVADVGPGDFHGELSLLDGGRRAANVTATSPMHIMVATQREFIAMLERFPTIAREVLPALASRARVLGDDAFMHASSTSPSGTGAWISPPERRARGHSRQGQHDQPRSELRFRRRRSPALSRSGSSNQL